MEHIQPMLDYAKENVMIVAGLLIAVLVIIYFGYNKYYSNETLKDTKKGKKSSKNKSDKGDDSEDSSETDELIESIHKKQAGK